MLRYFGPGSKGRRLILFALSSLLAIATGVMAYTTHLASATDNDNYHYRRLIPNTDVNPFGANFFLAQEVEEWKMRKTLQMAKEAGIGWAKQQFSWEEIQPRKPKPGEDPERSYTWDKADRLINLFQEYGLEVIARLDRPPDWAKAGGIGSQGPLDNYDDYANFIYAFVNRYRSQVRYIQIWNEPNLWYEWGNSPPDPKQYTTLLCLAYRKAKEANPNVYVLSAPLAQTTERSARAMPEMEFLDQMYRYGAKDCFDILSANAFGFGWPPEDPPNQEKLNFARVLLLRDVMVRNGDANKAVWFNEFGWNASPEGYPPDWYIWQRVSEPDQAAYSIRAVQKARNEWGWVGVLNIWYFRQVGNITPDRSDYYFRMVDVDFTPRLIYHAVKEASAGLGVASRGYFEESNPAVSVRGGWQVIRDERASGGAYLAPTTPGATLSFAFRGDSLELVVTKDTKGRQLRVTIDGYSANRLPSDEKGYGVLRLDSPGPRWQERVLVASNLVGGRHTAQITLLSEETTPTMPYPIWPAEPVRPSLWQGGGIDAFIVSGSSRDLRPYQVTVLLLLALTGIAGGLWLRETMRARGGTESHG